MSGSANDFLSELRWRGLLQQVTHEDALTTHLASADASRGGRRAYVGFDPTADSLTIGNLVGIIQLARWQKCGHTPVVIMGGGTGFIGDPSGKSSERMLLSPEQIASNVQSIKRIFDNVIAFDKSKPNAGVMLDNYEWLSAMSYLTALRDVGKHFSVNMMMQKESVKERLHNRDQGISYTEFSYMILQAYDYAHLFEKHGVTVQMGGSDQFGNIVCGTDLIRRQRIQATSESMERHGQRADLLKEGSLDQRVEEAVYKDDRDEIRRLESGTLQLAFGITWPLVTKADGGKFGKTESGAVWLTAERTSPYQFYQFWLNSADADVIRFLKVYTFFTREEIDALEKSLATNPGKREAQKALARHMTELLHGKDELAKVEETTRALFAKADPDGQFVLPDEVLKSAPTTQHDRNLLEGVGMSLVDLLAQTSLCKSKTEARTQLAQGGISVNGHVAATDARVTAGSLISGDVIALRRGKKTWHVTRWA